ncbi:phospholipid-transporting ATPase ABCA3-like isoform X2 [Rhipicephalus microplus]|uniref:phospholipid-transporting ATPase ABCA3-like isoform X2 n=1 Tax=Rhipicephalus microplus TaxID=6941 RepID=UPI003F6CD3B0
MFFPPFALSASTVRAVNLKYEVAICDYLRGRKKLLDKHFDFCNTVKAFGAAMRFCCDVLTNRTDSEWQEFHALSTSPHGILQDVLTMILLGFLVFLYLLYRALGLPPLLRQKTEPPAMRPGHKEDEDVAAERAAVELICRQQRFAEHTLVARCLHKMYGQLHAVRGLSFALKPGECFGLLGVNGAGKTTTFRMLAGLIPATYGNAFMKDAVLSDDIRKWQSRLGYCPQGGALLNQLNAYETLYLYGRLRGVPEHVLPGAVDYVLYVTDLSDQAGKKCMHYSMEECELSCDRICIMVDGEMVCLGTLQHIKDRFGKGYKLLFTLEEDTWPAVEQLARGVRHSLPGVTVVDVRRKVVEFRMEGKLPWSTLFQKLAVLEKEFPFEHVLVSDNTLEQIFIEFARKAHAEKPRHALVPGTTTTATTATTSTSATPASTATTATI